jgi:hypothetical protein
VMLTRNTSGLAGVTIIYQRIPLELYGPNIRSAERLSLCLGRPGASACQSRSRAKCLRLHKPESFVAKYEGGERGVDVVEFIEICKALEADPNKLLKVLIQRVA